VPSLNGVLLFKQTYLPFVIIVPGTFRNPFPLMQDKTFYDVYSLQPLSGSGALLYILFHFIVIQPVCKYGPAMKTGKTVLHSAMQKPEKYYFNIPTRPM
jgi:hypothetical protein